MRRNRKPKNLVLVAATDLERWRGIHGREFNFRSYQEAQDGTLCADDFTEDVVLFHPWDALPIPGDSAPLLTIARRLRVFLPRIQRLWAIFDIPSAAHPFAELLALSELLTWILGGPAISVVSPAAPHERLVIVGRRRSNASSTPELSFRLQPLVEPTGSRPRVQALAQGEDSGELAALTTTVNGGVLHAIPRPLTSRLAPAWARSLAQTVVDIHIEFPFDPNTAPIQLPLWDEVVVHVNGEPVELPGGLASALLVHLYPALHGGAAVSTKQAQSLLGLKTAEAAQKRRSRLRIHLQDANFDILPARSQTWRFQPTFRVTSGVYDSKVRTAESVSTERMDCQ